MPTPLRSAAAIRVTLALPSELWNQLLAAALAPYSDLAITTASAAPGAAAVLSSPAVWVTATPTDHAGWTQLRRWCQREGWRVLVVGENRPQLAARALRSGASGYLDWESPVAVVAKAIRSVHAGELWADRKVALTLLQPPRPTTANKLTPRELRVLEALAEGKRNKEIAAQLAITETTVKSHLNRAYQKIHVSDRLGAALYVERHGLD